MDIQIPPNPQELDELSIFLQKECIPQQGMSLEMADGLMSAMIVGPSLTPPSEWLGAVLGDGAFDSQESANRLTGTLLRRFNQIVREIENASEEESSRYRPIVADVAEESLSAEDDSDYGSDWSRGFLYGMNYDLKAWTELVENQEFSAVLTPIMLLNTGTMHAVLDEDITHQSRKDLVKMIPQSLEIIWKYWEVERQEAARKFASNRAERSLKISRNDACPCGSGKKYKKCCLQ